VIQKAVQSDRDVIICLQVLGEIGKPNNRKLARIN